MLLFSGCLAPIARRPDRVRRLSCPPFGAQPLSPDIVGVNRLDVADMHGKRFIQEIVNAARTQWSSP